MMRIIALLGLAAWLAACAAPAGLFDTAPAAPEPVIEAEPAVRTTPCPKAEDGIGGTGCPDL